MKGRTPEVYPAQGRGGYGDISINGGGCIEGVGDPGGAGDRPMKNPELKP